MTEANCIGGIANYTSYFARHTMYDVYAATRRKIPRFNARHFGFPISPPLSLGCFFQPLHPRPLPGEVGGGGNIGRDFSARAAESRKILEGKPVTIDFTCFLSEIALFFSLSLFLFPLRRLAPSRFGSTRRRSIRYRGPHDHLGGPPRAKSSQGFWD